MRSPLVASDFVVPNGLETETFRLRMLSVHDLIKDYDAVMASREQIQGVFGPQSQWPTADLSLEQDLIDLGWHQKEFQNRTSFAYTVMSLDESRCLGCVYVYPTHSQTYDAQVILWARTIKEEQKNSLEEKLLSAVKQWMREDWPFANVAFPGRDIAWEKLNDINIIDI